MGGTTGRCILLPLLIISTASRIVFSIAADTLLPSQSLRDGQTLVSANKTFEFGFFSPGSSTNRYVGIWYHKVPKQTLVWVANRDNAIADKSGVLMFDDNNGDLILLDGRGSSSVLASGLGTNNREATILDSGNLVLRSSDNTSMVSWQSFDHPTDTFLPGMKLGLNRRQNRLLTSWKSKDDPALGDFSLGLDPSGNDKFLIWKKGTPYWSSGDWDGKIFRAVPEMTPDYIFNYEFVRDQHELYFTYSMKDDSIISRLIIGISGQIQQMSWLEIETSWILFWSQPRTQCNVYDLCGAFGVCNEAIQPKACECLPGFQPASLQDWFEGSTGGGCLRKTSLQCESGEKPDKFVEMPHMKFNANATKLDVSDAKDCESACHKHCNCTAYAFSGGCSLWQGDLVNLQQVDGGENIASGTLYIRVADSESQGAQVSEPKISSDHKGKKRKLLQIMASVAASLTLLLSCSLVCFLWFRKRRSRDTKRSHEEKSLLALVNHLPIKIGEGDRAAEFLLYHFSDIEKATSNFSAENKLGEGGFGPVYKGQLPEGQEIAVKRLSARSGQGLLEFSNEIILIAKLQHRNLVRLLGYCIQGEEKLLVYEYMPNKSLDFFLFDSTRGALLDWSKRAHIIEGIAQGLLYLHKHSRLRVIHRDLKASNILLDADVNPKISDFGMARIFGSNETQANTNRVVGTYGYMAPEYASHGQFSIKSDVFSFGVLLLEIVTGKRSAGFHQYGGNALNLLGHAWELWKAGNWSELMDPSLGDGCPSWEVSRCIHVALMCVQENAGDRPTMSDVIAMLGNESVALADPKQPAFFTVATATEAEHASMLAANCSLNDMTITTPEGRYKENVYMKDDKGDTLTSSTPLSDNQTLTSAGGIFELGFFRPGNSSEWYLGIWYKEIPDQPIVWVANRDTPLNGSVRILNLTADGNLLLLNKDANILWSTNTSNATYPLLQLSDSGNLILTGGIPKSILWQSFDHPSDTFLAGMKIGLDFAAKLDRHLISWKSSSDPSPGNYSYGMDPHGVPEVYIWEGSSRTFRTGPWNGKGWSGRPDMWTNGVLRFHFVMNQHEVYYTFESLNKSVHCRAVLDASGVLQRLVWSTASNRWDLFWLVPEDPCDQYATCGANGMCTTIYSPRCQCLQGFTPKSPKDWDLRENSDGCVRRTGLNCSTDGFFPLQNVKLPDTSNASTESNKTLNECQDLCLKNCSCLAYALNGESMCITWLSDLVDIRMFIEGGDDLYIRLAASELDSISNSGNKIRLAIAVTIPVLSSLLLLCVAFLLWLKRRRRRNHGKVMSSHSIGSKESELELPLFDVRRIKAATDDFSVDKILGVGGFGPVYKGQLEDGHEVAVKRLSKNSIQGIDEFKTEVMLIAKLQHRNLVRLLGYCIEDEERMLIYEYMQNTSLDAFIFDKRKSSLLNWQKRLDIIIGIARGLLYLHQDSRLRVIHRDLKASNILLDHEMNPKISDFGTARTFRAGQTEGNTKRVVGTCGYMSPEYAMGGLFSEKSDVFSFGVMLLEILSGKKNNVVLQADQRINLLGHAWMLWKQGRCLELLEESIGHSYPVSEVFRCFQVGLLCVQEGSGDRPTMGEVVLMLSSESVMLPQPNRPGFYVTRTSIGEDCSPSEITMTELEGR
ncbi:unnamed protein product [Musa acuminata subsp. burmannicoides]